MPLARVKFEIDRACQELDRELDEVSDKRRKLDADNEESQKEVERLTATFLKAKAKNDRLKVEHNAVLANQIFLTARWVTFELGAHA